eukprot:TRINITY_DN7996_c0_g1_i2.p1 TRINITY_DN7996_c0_g1~~TRINITY_DN7996_c0_g1_i2.p1  ORF type:complete len:231 (+),score=44.32 TRINITY_DN7996_c0_g1_i2:175-867(+)
MDLSDLESVQSAAHFFLSKNIPLDILILNAGVAKVGDTTKQGYELMFGVNYLGHFLFTTLVVPHIIQYSSPSSPSRIVVVCSSSHQLFSDPTYDIQKLPNTTWNLLNIFKGYGTSKLMTVYFMHSLARRLSNTNVTVNGLCPGIVFSEWHRNFPWYLRWVLAPIMKYCFSTTEQGAGTIVYAATDATLSSTSSQYFTQSTISHCADFANNEEKEEELWQLSEKLVADYLQ